MKCRICDSTRLKLYLDLGNQPHCNGFLKSEAEFAGEKRVPLRMFFCEDCSLSQLDTSFTQEEMFLDHPYVSGTTKTLVEHFHRQAKQLVDTYHLSKDQLVVDIGSNDGTFLKGFQPYARVLGVEPAEKIAADAVKAGVDTATEFFNEPTAEKLIPKYGQASLITAAGVFFHVPDLHDVCRGIVKLLKKDGVFFVQAIYLKRVLNANSFDNFYHEHLVMYTFKTLRHLLKLHGLEVFHVDLAEIHGGSLSVHAGHPGQHPVQPSVQRYLDDETREGLDRFETYQKFAERVLENKKRLVSMIRDLRAQGKSIHTYGAPAKGNTLLNFFELGPKDIDCAVEKNPRKVGQFTPGTHIPVLDEAKIGKTPDYYLVLAWNFLPEFLEKEKPFFAKGGKFIVPIPEPRILPE